MNDAWFGLLGTAFGILLGGLLTWAIGRSQWAREQGVRWHVDRRNAYAEFLAAGDDYEDIVYALAADEQCVANPWEVDRSELDRAYGRLRNASTQLMLFAGLEVGRWASKYLQLLVPAFAELHEGHSFGPYGWAAVNLDMVESHPNEQFGTARSHFIGAARAELGLKAPILWRGLPPSLGLRTPGRKPQP